MCAHAPQELGGDHAVERAGGPHDRQRLTIGRIAIESPRRVADDDRPLDNGPSRSRIATLRLVDDRGGGDRPVARRGW